MLCSTYWWTFWGKKGSNTLKSRYIYIYMHISSLCLVISRSDVQHQWDHKNSYLYHIYDWPRTSRWMLLVSFRLAASSVCHHRLIQQTESFVLNQNTLPNISFLLLYSKCLLKMRNWPQFSLSGQHIFMVIVSSSSQISKEQYRAGHQQSTKKNKSHVLTPSLKYQTQRRRNLSSFIDWRHRLKCL